MYFNYYIKITTPHVQHQNKNTRRIRTARYRAAISYVDDIRQHPVANCREQRIGKTDGAKGHRGHSRVLNARNG